MKLPLTKIPGGYILITTLFLFLSAVFFLKMYGVIHWETMRESHHLKFRLDALKKDPDTINEIKNNKNIYQAFQEIENSTAKLVKSNHKLMRIFNLYHIFGLVCFLVSITSLFCTPRKLAFICIPLGVLSLIISIIIM